MSINNPNLKTFCPAPWFQIWNENNKDKKPCCKIKLKEGSFDQQPLNMLNNSEMLDIKQKLHIGIRAEQCNRCWIEEENGFKSQRQNLLGILTKDKGFTNSWLKSYFNKKTNWNSDFLAAADIKIGNTCNFQCVMCHPGDSSMIYNDWIKKQDSEFVQDHLKKDPKYFEKLKNRGFKDQYYRQYVDSIFNTTNNLLWLRLLGGEPLLDNNLIEKIKNLPDAKKKKLKLSFITNGSVDLKKTLEYIDSTKFDLIQFNISLEGIGSMQEYARYNSNWKQICNNILSIKNYSKNIQINLTYVIQTVTILRLHELLNWIKENNFYLGVSPCFIPEYLSLKTLPYNLRKKVIHNLSNFTDFIKQNPNSDEGNGTLDGSQFINFLQSPNFSFDRMLFEKFLRYIKWYEQTKKIPKLTEIIPEWKEYFKK